MDSKSIIEAAKRELKEEQFRAAVEQEKQRLRTHRPWWHRFIPFVITIKWRD